MQIKPIQIPTKAEAISVNYSTDGTTISETLPIASVTFDDSADIQAYKDALTAIQALPIDAANMAAINDIAGKIVSNAATDNPTEETHIE